MKDLHAAEFMEKDPVAARPEMSLAELVELLWTHHVRALPVVDDRGNLIGVISETDLFLKEKGVPFSLEKVTTLLGEPLTRRHLEGHERSDKVTVSEVMSSHPIAIRPETTLEDAAMLMHKRHLSVLPVISGERLVGIVRRISLLLRIYGRQAAEG